MSIVSITKTGFVKAAIALAKVQLAGIVPIAPQPLINPEFLNIENQSSPDLFGSFTHTFNITATAETDGAVIVILVQKKNMGVSVTSIEVDAGPVTGALHSVGSNPGAQENQMAAFEVKPFSPGVHTVKVSNADGMDGVSIVAVYYKKYTELGNFADDFINGALGSTVVLGDSAHPIRKGNRGSSIVFAGGLDNLVSEIPQEPYDETVNEFSTTDVGTNRFNGRLKTAGVEEFVGDTTDVRWTITYDGPGTLADCIVLFGEVANSFLMTNGSGDTLVNGSGDIIYTTGSL